MAKKSQSESGRLLRIEDFEAFKEVKDHPSKAMTDVIVACVRKLDEREELEPFIRTILFDANATPHGPAEIVDILTHKVSVGGKAGTAAFILKGRSFSTVRPRDVAHQIYRLEKIADLSYAVFASTGNVLDAAKEQFISTACRLNCGYSVFDAIDIGRLLVAYGFLCPRDGRRISAGRCSCGYSPQRRVLNILQTDSLKALAEARQLSQTAGLIVLPTGSGKTRIAAEDAKAAKASRVLYVAHTYEILDVAEAEFSALFSAAKVTRHVKGATLTTPNLVNITTIQLLRHNLHRVKAGEFDYVVVDEFHHAAAKSYRQLLSRVQPNFLLGLTATPIRGDRQDIAELCGHNILINFELRSGIDCGILAPYFYYGCFDNIDYSRIRYNGARYDVRDLERALIIPERDSAIIASWRKHAADKPTLAFCCTQRHARRVAQSFADNGIPAAVYLAETSIEERRKLIERLRLGKVKVLCVVDVLNEGADIPFVECLLFLRPTDSQRIFYQQLGRGLRKYVGKAQCIVIDFIGNFRNAYKIVEYQGLLPLDDDETSSPFRFVRSSKDVLNLPLGCEVHFDDRVIELFSRQLLDPRNATRHNIGRILIYQYERLERSLQRRPTRRDVDRSLILDSSFYRLVFGSWQHFEKLVEQNQPRPAS